MLSKCWCYKGTGQVYHCEAMVHLPRPLVTPTPCNIKQICSISHFPTSYNVKKFKVGTLLKNYIEERAREVALYIIESNATVRQTAKKFGISKSTVHKDVTERLEQIDPTLAKRARVVLDINKSERHIRGGLATKEKYARQH